MDRVQECIDLIKKAYQIYIVLPAEGKEKVDEYMDKFEEENKSEEEDEQAN